VVSGIENGEPLTRALRPDTGATVWSVSSQIEPRVLAVDRRGRRVYIAGPSPNGFFVEAYAVPGLIPVESSTWLAGGDLFLLLAPDLPADLGVLVRARRQGNERRRSIREVSRLA
jgi:hypothetical protein